MNRKWIALLLCCSLVLVFAAACGRNKDNAAEPNNGVNDNMNNGSNANNGSNGNSGNNTNSNPNGSNDTNIPGNMTPGNDASSNLGDTSMDGENGNYPTFPNSLATMDADVAVKDLFDTLGLTETDLDNAMRDIATVGDGVDGARTYRHKLLGEDADVSYGFDDQRTINKVTVKAQAATADEWRNELMDTLGAKEVEGQMDSWTYDENQIKIDDQGDHVLITIEKKA